MSIRDTLFRIASEFHTTDVDKLADIDMFIADAQTDVGGAVPTFHVKYERAIAYYAAGLMFDADPNKGAGAGFGVRREKTSLGEIEYQMKKYGTRSNRYFDKYYDILGSLAKQIGFTANRR